MNRSEQIQGGISGCLKVFRWRWDVFMDQEAAAQRNVVGGAVQS